MLLTPRDATIHIWRTDRHTWLAVRGVPSACKAISSDLYLRFPLAGRRQYWHPEQRAWRLPRDWHPKLLDWASLLVIPDAIREYPPEPYHP